MPAIKTVDHENIVKLLKTPKKKADGRKAKKGKKGTILLEILVV